ncbi:hypothetical protein GGI24_006999, partial [Coemansia furcata]
MSDDSDAEFMSFASAPGPSNSTAVATYASPDDKRQRRPHKKRRTDEPRERSGRHRSSHHRDERKAITQRPAVGMDLWSQLLEDGVLSVDRRGDSNLLMFKETSKSTAPKFVRRGGRRVLGLGGSFRVESDDGQRINLVRNMDVPKRYMDIDWASQRHMIEHVEPALNVLASVDFIPLGEPAIRSVDSVSKIYDSDAGGASSAQPDFRSMDGRAKDPSYQVQPAPIDDDQPIVRSETQTKMIELERL